MAEVRLKIAGREYIVTCKDGEEKRLQSLGAMVDNMATQAGGPTGGLNESRLLLFSALLLADKLHDSDSATVTPAATAPEAAVGQAVETLAKLAERLEILADKLEQ